MGAPLVDAREQGAQRLNPGAQMNARLCEAVKSAVYPTSSGRCGADRRVVTYSAENALLMAFHRPILAPKRATKRQQIPQSPPKTSNMREIGGPRTTRQVRSPRRFHSGRPVAYSGARSRLNTLSTGRRRRPYA